MIEDMMVAAKLAEVERERHRWQWSLPQGPLSMRRPVPSYQPVVERPRPDATRILSRWLAARRAAMRAARVPAPPCCGKGRAA